MRHQTWKPRTSYEEYEQELERDRERTREALEAFRKHNGYSPKVAVNRHVLRIVFITCFVIAIALYCLTLR